MIELTRDTPAKGSSESRVALVPRLANAIYSELGIGSVPWRYLLFNGLVSLLPTFSMYRTRVLLYRLAGFKIDKHAVIHGKLTFIGRRDIYQRLHVGEGCRINAPCFIGLTEDVTLEKRAVIGYGVTITTAVHETDAPECRAGAVFGRPVRICEGAWIAANVTILPGVTIGPGAIVGAGSVVTRDIPPHTFASGVPARPIRTLIQESTKQHSIPGSPGTDRLERRSDATPNPCKAD